MIKCFVFAILLGLVLASTSGHAADIKIGMATPPTVIDPHAAEIGPNVDVRMHMFGSLVRMGANEELRPPLAESWCLVEAPLVWEFKLRAGVKFHDGAPITMHDAPPAHRSAVAT